MTLRQPGVNVCKSDYSMLGSYAGEAHEKSDHVARLHSLTVPSRAAARHGYDFFPFPFSQSNVTDQGLNRRLLG